MQNLLRAPVLKALLPPAHGDGAGACGLRLAARLATRAIADPTPRLRAPARSGSIGARIRTFGSTSGAGCAKRMRLADFWKSMGIRENPPAGEILRVTLAFFGTSRNFCSFWGVAHSREAFEKQWFGSFFAWHIHERALFLPG